MGMELEAARTLRRAVENNFLLMPDGLREYYPPNPDDPAYAYLWSVFATTGMLHAAFEVDAEAQETFKSLIGGFRHYRDTAMPDGFSKYHSERGRTGGAGACFFDDNIWIARNLLFALDDLGGEEYLREAERVASYVRSGWNEALGGLVWNEKGLTDQGNAQDLERGLSANACSALVHALLYKRTSIAEYMDWALRFYTFCERMRDPVSGVYNNGIHTVIENGRRMDGAVNTDQYGYNSGSMILVDVALFEITNDERYLRDARRSARAVHAAHFRQDPETGVPYAQDFVWFTAIQAEGYLALLPYDHDNICQYLQALKCSLDHALATTPRRDGLLPHDFSRGWRKENDHYDRLLLTHSGIAEIAYLLDKAQRAGAIF